MDSSQNNNDSKAHLLSSRNLQNLINREEVAIVVKKAISRDAEYTDYRLEPYSEEKLGFLGSHLRLIVTVKFGTNSKETLSFFVKTLPYDVPVQAAYIQETGFFKREVDFFNYLVPILTKDFKSESWAPKCYLAKENLLVFEDMKIKGFSNRPRELEEKDLRAAIACIARFHASSLLAEESLNGKSLNHLCPELLEEREFRRKGSSYTKYKVAMDFAVSLANEMGLDSSRIYEASERVFDLSEPSKTKRNVVSHGDLWSSNLIFDDSDKCKLSDFQTIRYSPLAHDFVQLMYLTTSKAFRKENERNMIDFYYNILTGILECNEFKSEVPSFEELLQGVEEQRFAAVVVAMIYHPIAWMDGKTASRIMNDAGNYEALYFKDRKPIVYEIMANFPDYETKIKEDVQELVELSLIVNTLPRPT